MARLRRRALSSVWLLTLPYMVLSQSAWLLLVPLSSLEAAATFSLADGRLPRMDPGAVTRNSAITLLESRILRDFFSWSYFDFGIYFTMQISNIPDLLSIAVYLRMWRHFRNLHQEVHPHPQPELVELEEPYGGIWVGGGDDLGEEGRVEEIGVGVFPVVGNDFLGEQVYRFKMYCFSVAGNLTEMKHFLFSLQATVLNKKPCTSRLIPNPTESTLGWREILLPSKAETECSRSKLGMREKAKLPQRPRLPPPFLLLPGTRLGR